MIIHDFLTWVETAPDGPRTEAAGALARAWLHSDLQGDERSGAAAALTFLLDDPCEDVRMALAQNLCRSEHAPRHILLCLAEDKPDIAAVVLSVSPLFSDADLIDVLAGSAKELQAVIATRIGLSAAVSAAIAEIGSEAACLKLLCNREAHLVPSSLIRLAERFGNENADIRENLLKRGDLPLQTRHALLLSHARALRAQALLEQNLSLSDGDRETDDERLSDASDKIALRLAGSASEAELYALADYLRGHALLNTRLLLRSVCCGRFRFFAVALANLSGVPGERVTRSLIAARPSAIRAVLRKAGLPMRSHQAFLLAIDMAREGGADLQFDLPLDQARELTEKLLAELQDETLGSNGDIPAFLRRFALEIARLEARAYIQYSSQKALSAA